ncbi:hypothetical protein CROQUDRAFT_46668, partial [Cronartium quercuum f. sp. fusiforme G11]
QCETAHHFNIKQSTISWWLKDKDKIQKDSHINGGAICKQHMAQYPELEQALYHWVIKAQEHHVPVNHEMIQMKAHHFSAILGIEMKFSNGWMTKFKKCYNICKVTLHGEASSVNPDDVASAHAQLLEITKDYKPHNI